MALLWILTIGLALYFHGQLGRLRSRLALLEGLAQFTAAAAPRPVAPASRAPGAPPDRAPVETASPARAPETIASATTGSTSVGNPDGSEAR